MRFQFRRKAGNKEYPNHHPACPPTTTKASKREADDENDNKEAHPFNQVVIEGLNSAEIVSVVSTSSQSDSRQSENLVVLLSIRSLSGLTISKRDVSTKGNKPRKWKTKKRDVATQRGKLRETLSSRVTTVVVSVEREFSEDGYPMETYLPSLALSAKNLWKSKVSDTQVCSAYWPNPETDDDRSVLNKSPPSTIQLNRKMQRVVYQRELAAEQASHFRHKRIDLNVSLSRGTEILRLGTASIAIAGNEEEEQIINAPIRALAMDDSLPRARCWTDNQKGCDNVFYDDQAHSYSLADNATLSLGVRVIAEEIIQHEEKIVEEERVHFMESKENRSMDQGTPLIRLSDETDLLSSPSLQTSDARISFNSAPAVSPFFSCCAADNLSISSILSHFSTDEPMDHDHCETREATVIPIYLLSDMSESTAMLTDGTDEEGSEEVTTTASSTLF